MVFMILIFSTFDVVVADGEEIKLRLYLDLKLGSCSLKVTILNYLVNTNCGNLEAKLI